MNEGDFIQEVPKNAQVSRSTDGFKSAKWLDEHRCWQHYYYCRYCGGWVKGLPFRDDHKVKAGRRGYATTCIRCGLDIVFVLTRKDGTR